MASEMDKSVGSSRDRGKLFGGKSKKNKKSGIGKLFFLIQFIKHNEFLIKKIIYHIMQLLFLIQFQVRVYEFTVSSSSTSSIIFINVSHIHIYKK